MSAKLTCVIAEYYKLFIRSFVAIFGCVAIWWGISEWPIFWQEAAAESVAGRVIAGEPFKAEILARQIAIIDGIERPTYCRPAALRSVAIIQLRMVEADPPATDRDHRDEHLNALSSAIRSSLSCSPADPFLWLVLYWVESTESGSKADYLKYLRMSYRLGPNEGWVGLKRNRITFAAIPKLPADLTEYAISEFIGLVEMWSYKQAAETLTGPAWPLRQQLLARLRNIEKRHRVAFADILYKMGYDVAIPGVETPGLRSQH